MNARECIMTRRSIRSFTDQKVSHETIDRIIEAASFAPSWKNTQVTRYVVVEGDVKNQVAKCTSGYAGNGTIIENAPMAVVITMVKNRSGYERDGSYSTHRGDGWQMFDTGVASEAFCLAAHEEGLGTVIMGIIDDDKIAEIIGLGEDREVVCVIPIGYPAESPVAPKRKGVTDLVTYLS